MVFKHGQAESGTPAGILTAFMPVCQVLESLGKLAAQVNHHQEEMCRMQRQIVEQHEMQMDLQRQQLEQYVLRSAAQPTKDLEQQLGRVQNVVASRVERTLSTALQRENILWFGALVSVALTNRVCSSLISSVRGVGSFNRVCSSLISSVRGVGSFN